MTARWTARGLISILAVFGLQAPVAAVSFDWAGFEGRFDTTVSVGATLRVADRDPELIAIVNGGTARSANGDDADLNFDRYDFTATALKATHDFELRKRRYGFFGRVNYFYDPVNDNNDFLGPQARDRVVFDANVLDAFVFWNTAIGERPLDIRAGKQVVNWGESTFIQNGINVINPIDVSKLRTPGAELREALLPSPILSIGFGLTDSLAMEAIYIADWEEIVIDPRNTYFSTNDFLSEDGGPVYTGFGRRNDQNQPLAPPAMPDPDNPDGPPIANPTAQVFVERAGRVEPDDGDEFGVSFRYFAQWLANTEFGLYYLDYHSRIPLVSVQRGSPSTALGGGTARYFAEYPENIRVTALSFNTDGPFGIAVQGEYSYRDNFPAQLASVELLLAALGAQNNITGDQASAAAVPEGTVINGFREVEMHQLQVTLTKAFGPSFGANQMVVLGEAGYNYLNLPSDLFFNGPGTVLPAPGSANAAGGSFQTAGFANRESWGYRGLARLDYANALGAATLSPRLVWRHDVNGVGPNFNQGSKAVTAGLGVNYLQVWTADISYTNFFGGRTFSGTDDQPPPPGQSADFATSANALKDRDFVSVNLSYAF